MKPRVSSIIGMDQLITIRSTITIRIKNPHKKNTPVTNLTIIIHYDMSAGGAKLSERAGDGRSHRRVRHLHSHTNPHTPLLRTAEEQARRPVLLLDKFYAGDDCVARTGRKG